MKNKISTEKRLYCLKWDLLNIEDLNEKREYLANRVFEIEQSLVSKNESLHLVSDSDIIHECNKCMFDKKLGFCPKCDTDCYSH